MLIEVKMKKDFQHTMGELMQIDNTTFACDLTFDVDEYYHTRDIQVSRKPETRLFDIHFPDTRFCTLSQDGKYFQEQQQCFFHESQFSRDINKTIIS